MVPVAFPEQGEWDLQHHKNHVLSCGCSFLEMWRSSVALRLGRFP